MTAKHSSSKPKFYDREILIFFLIYQFKHVFKVLKKNHLIEMSLLSTNNKPYELEIRKIIFNYTLLSGGMLLFL